MPNQLSTSPPLSGETPLPTTEKSISRDKSPRPRRRNRLITSCLECRRRKLKCDKQQPCINCTKFSRSCVFIQVDPQAQAKLAEVKEKMGMLEKSLEEEVTLKNSAKRASRSSSYEAPVLPGQEAGYSDQEDDDNLKGLQENKLIVEDASYYDDEDNDDLVDLGFAFGKLRLTDRVGGLVRPRFADELAAFKNDIPGEDGPNLYAGQSPESWISPGNDYVEPSSSFFLDAALHDTSLVTDLPPKEIVDKILTHYWEFVHVITQTIHRSSFERYYPVFWHHIMLGVQTRPSYRALLFAMLLSSIISMSDVRVHADFGVEKSNLVDKFKQGTELALARANLLRTTKLETVQAFVTYLIPLCRAEVSRAHSALVGTCIRIAECMGMHRDPTWYSKDVIEIQIRRLIWYQIISLDIRTGEAVGPRVQIRRDDYDTKLPLNVDDDVLDRAAQSGEQITEDSKHFTSMTITRMRLECNEMIRYNIMESPKLFKKAETGGKRVTITSLLKRIQTFSKAVEQTYLPMLDKTIPLHVVAMEFYGILSGRLYARLLHPFASSTYNKRLMPERLRQIMMSASIMMIEHTMTVEQHPVLSQWGWYIGALHQHQIALLLLAELYITTPDSAFATRAWRCLDYSFDLPAHLPQTTKARMVWGEISDRSRQYLSTRRIRPPTNMPQLGTSNSRSDEKTKIQIPPENDDGRGFEFALQTSSNNKLLEQASFEPIQAPSHQTHQQQPYMPLGSVPVTNWESMGMSVGMGVGNLQPPPLMTSGPSMVDFGNYTPAALFPNGTSVPFVENENTYGIPGIGNQGQANHHERNASAMESTLSDTDWVSSIPPRSCCCIGADSCV
ncbi:hypothetical protein DM02DRAFT_569195 [Periconia macrospinosa]|uniref:Zn(2)-C6 fungal-type domain-containing protein n=1 Tax=Periconia macrospinosa TaxID=97972 RepID=A0A2V1DER9_9PLEO|nr:hypothetical protein DM02DRAFT_569195 [Periconia macrospinosa]